MDPGTHWCYERSVIHAQGPSPIEGPDTHPPPPAGGQERACRGETATSCVRMQALAVQAVEVSLPQDAVDLMVGQQGGGCGQLRGGGGRGVGGVHEGGEGAAGHGHSVPGQGVLVELTAAASHQVVWAADPTALTVRRLSITGVSAGLRGQRMCSAGSLGLRDQLALLVLPTALPLPVLSQHGET